MRLALFSVILSLGWFAALVDSQGESCTAADNRRGLCTELPSCTSLITLYRQNPSEETISILRSNQARCGNKKVGRNPLMCCSDNVPQEITQPASRQEPACYTPDNIVGYCINVKQCPSVLNTFIQRQKDPEYVKYIRQSNANCNYVSQTICCPNEAPATNTGSGGGGGGGVATRGGLLNPPQCGVSKVPHNRVVGGVPAQLGGWPWMALLGYRNTLGEVSVGWKCGGSIITSRHILTAAHCIRNDLVVARLGEHDLSTDGEAQHIDIGVKEKIRHPSYDKSDGHSDVAILVLESEIPFSSSITPVCLPIDEPERSKRLNGYTPFAAGWGRTQEGGKSANVLQEIQLPVVDNEKCKGNYQAINKVISQKQFDNGVLCAGYQEGGRDTCNGDSGGPLMMPFSRQGIFYYYQVGVVSYGIGCARAEVPGVYARVSQFTDWIRSTVEST